MNGYIQIELGGKPRGLKFNMAANDELVVRVASHKGRVSETQMAYDVVYCGLLGNAVAKDIEPDFTYEDVTEWVDGLYLNGKAQVLADILTCYTETQAYKALFVKEEEKQTKAPAKKKVLKSKSSRSTK